MVATSQRRELGILLFVANRSLEERAFDAVIAAGITDITSAQAKVAARIGPDGTRVSDIAAQALVAAQAHLAHATAGQDRSLFVAAGKVGVRELLPAHGAQRRRSDENSGQRGLLLGVGGAVAREGWRRGVNVSRWSSAASEVWFLLPVTVSP